MWITANFQDNREDIMNICVYGAASARLEEIYYKKTQLISRHYPLTAITNFNSIMGKLWGILNTHPIMTRKDHCLFITNIL